MSKKTEFYGKSYIEHNHPELRAKLQDIEAQIKHLNKVTEDNIKQIIQAVNSFQKKAVKVQQDIQDTFNNFFEILNKQKEEKVDDLEVQP